MVFNWDVGNEPWLEENRHVMVGLGLVPTEDFYKLPEDVRMGEFLQARSSGEGSRYLHVDQDVWGRAMHSQTEPVTNISRDLCFIATSAFEDQNHPVVDSLRDYRDQVLSQTPFGRAVTALYYAGLGQAGARVLDAIPTLKPAVRFGLEMLVRTVVEPRLDTAPAEYRNS